MAESGSQESSPKPSVPPAPLGGEAPRPPIPAPIESGKPQGEQQEQNPDPHGLSGQVRFGADEYSYPPRYREEVQEGLEQVARGEIPGEEGDEAVQPAETGGGKSVPREERQLSRRPQVRPAPGSAPEPERKPGGGKEEGASGEEPPIAAPKRPSPADMPRKRPVAEPSGAPRTDESGTSTPPPAEKKPDLPQPAAPLPRGEENQGVFKRKRGERLPTSDERGGRNKPIEDPGGKLVAGKPADESPPEESDTPSSPEPAPPAPVSPGSAEDRPTAGRGEAPPAGAPGAPDTAGTPDHPRPDIGRPVSGEGGGGPDTRVPLTDDREGTLIPPSSTPAEGERERRRPLMPAPDAEEPEGDDARRREREEPPPDTETDETHPPTDEEPPLDMQHTITLINREEDAQKRALELVDSQIEAARKRNNWKNPLHWPRMFGLRVAESHLRRRGIKRAKQAMIKNNNVFLQINVIGKGAKHLEFQDFRTQERTEARAKIEQIKLENEAQLGEDVHKIRRAAGPLERLLTNEVLIPLMNLPSGMSQEDQEMQTQQLLRTMVNRHLNDRVVGRQLQEFFGKKATGFNEVASVFATDMLVVRDALKASIDRHRERITDIKQYIHDHVRINLAKTTWGADTKVKLRGADRALDFVERSILPGGRGFLWNETTLSAGASIGAQVLKQGTVRALQAGMITGGVFAAFERNKNLSHDIAAYRRGIEYGEQAADIKKLGRFDQRAQLQRHGGYEFASVADMLMSNEDRKVVGGDSRSFNTLMGLDLAQQGNREALIRRIAEMRTRLIFGAKEKAGITQGTGQFTKESDRLLLTKAFVQGRRALLAAGMPPEEFDEALRGSTIEWKKQFLKNKKDQDRDFLFYRVKSVALFGGFGGLASLATAIVSQQGAKLGGEFILDRPANQTIGENIVENVSNFVSSQDQQPNETIATRLQQTLDQLKQNPGTPVEFEGVEFHVKENGNIVLDGFRGLDFNFNVPPELQFDAKEQHFVFHGDLPPLVDEKLEEAGFRVRELLPSNTMLSEVVKAPVPGTDFKVDLPQGTYLREVGSSGKYELWTKDAKPILLANQIEFDNQGRMIGSHVIREDLIQLGEGKGGTTEMSTKQWLKQNTTHVDRWGWYDEIKAHRSDQNELMLYDDRVGKRAVRWDMSNMGVSTNTSGALPPVDVQKLIDGKLDNKYAAMAFWDPDNARDPILVKAQDGKLTLDQTDWKKMVKVYKDGQWTKMPGAEIANIVFAKDLGGFQGSSNATGYMHKFNMNVSAGILSEKNGKVSFGSFATDLSRGDVPTTTKHVPEVARFESIQKPLTVIDVPDSFDAGLIAASVTPRRAVPSGERPDQPAATLRTDRPEQRPPEPERVPDYRIENDQRFRRTRPRNADANDPIYQEEFIVQPHPTDPDKVILVGDRGTEEEVNRNRFLDDDFDFDLVTPPPSPEDEVEEPSPRRRRRVATEAEEERIMPRRQERYRAPDGREYWIDYSRGQALRRGVPPSLARRLGIAQDRITVFPVDPNARNGYGEPQSMTEADLMQRMEDEKWERVSEREQERRERTPLQQIRMDVNSVEDAEERQRLYDILSVIEQQVNPADDAIYGRLRLENYDAVLDGPEPDNEARRKEWQERVQHILSPENNTGITIYGIAAALDRERRVPQLENMMELTPPLPLIPLEDQPQAIRRVEELLRQSPLDHELSHADVRLLYDTFTQYLPRAEVGGLPRGFDTTVANDMNQYLDQRLIALGIAMDAADRERAVNILGHFVADNMDALQLGIGGTQRRHELIDMYVALYHPEGGVRPQPQPQPQSATGGQPKPRRNGTEGPTVDDFEGRIFLSSEEPDRRYHVRSINLNPAGGRNVVLAWTDASGRERTRSLDWEDFQRELHGGRLNEYVPEQPKSAEAKLPPPRQEQVLQEVKAHISDPEGQDRAENQIRQFLEDAKEQGIGGTQSLLLVENMIPIQQQRAMAVAFAGDPDGTRSEVEQAVRTLFNPKTGAPVSPINQETVNAITYFLHHYSGWRRPAYYPAMIRLFIALKDIQFDPRIMS